jgi:hypothetical protein
MSVYNVSDKSDILELIKDNIMASDRKYTTKLLEWLDMFSSYIEDNKDNSSVIYEHLQETGANLTKDVGINFPKLTTFLIKFKNAVKSGDYEGLSIIKENIQKMIT